jgi:hypothetical protein
VNKLLVAQAENNTRQQPSEADDSAMKMSFQAVYEHIIDLKKAPGSITLTTIAQYFRECNDSASTKSQLLTLLKWKGNDSVRRCLIEFEQQLANRLSGNLWREHFLKWAKKYIESTFGLREIGQQVLTLINEEFDEEDRHTAQDVGILTMANMDFLMLIGLRGMEVYSKHTHARAWLDSFPELRMTNEAMLDKEKPETWNLTDVFFISRNASTNSKHSLRGRKQVQRPRLSSASASTDDTKTQLDDMRQQLDRATKESEQQTQRADMNQQRAEQQQTRAARIQTDYDYQRTRNQNYHSNSTETDARTASDKLDDDRRARNTEEDKIADKHRDHARSQYDPTRDNTKIKAEHPVPDLHPFDARSREPPTALCRDYALGNCTRRQCRYTHDRAPPNTGTPGAAPCFNYPHGTCTAQPTCRYSHDPNNPPIPRAHAPLAPAPRAPAPPPAHQAQYTNMGRTDQTAAPPPARLPRTPPIIRSAAEVALRANEPCRSFAAGSCRRFPCPFKHA